MRKNIIAGNWKMNMDLAQTKELCAGLVNKPELEKNIEVVVCPPFVNLETAYDQIKNTKIKLGAQNMYFEDKGAYTGEISAGMLKACHCDYVILGHSERRKIFEETNGVVNLKVKAALQAGLMPIVCVGEVLEEREQNKTIDVVKEQLQQSLAGIKELVGREADKLVIAYEPVWAIGTGKVATPEQAQEVHNYIRYQLDYLLEDGVAEKISILYGGSVKPDNVLELSKQVDIDGALVGGASLEGPSFLGIMKDYYIK
jgi:triosephosphate isomerase